MNNDNLHNDDRFDAELPLPKKDSSGGSVKPSDDSANPAADLIRKKVASAYGQEPDSSEEALDVAELGDALKRSAHQEFIYGLTSSGKSLAEIQQSWHEYYAGLPDKQKHQVWQEFYSAHAQASHFAAASKSMAPKAKKPAKKTIPAKRRPKKLTPATESQLARTLADVKESLLGTLPGAVLNRQAQGLRSILFGLGVGSIVLIIFLFSFFNERFIAPFIQPSRTVSNTPIISDSQVGPNPEIIIPKINVQIPVVYGVSTIEEPAIETALESGVVHYADTAAPGQNGNVVIVGHSSNNIFNKGKYKFAFVLLSRLDNGDTFYLQKDGKRFTYQIYKKQIVAPTDTSVLASRDKPATATLITCDPPGTSTNRLVVVGQQISPDPLANAPQNGNKTLLTQSTIIPGNAPSLWSRLTKWFTQ